MTVQQYRQQFNIFMERVGKRYAALEENEKNMLRKLARSPEGIVLAKVLGDEFMSKFNLGQPTEETKRRGLASR
tara:strand:- start:1190 stop:1411 length:222 start_codon:yes stop_codon:yes gene_type:complete